MGLLSPGRIALWSQYGAFLLLLLQLILMFLLACAALPDDADEGDLATYYAHNRRYFWSLFALVAMMATITNLVVATVRHDSTTALLQKAIPNALYVCVMLTLALVRAKPVHYVLVPLLLVVMLLGWFPLRIG